MYSDAIREFENQIENSSQVLLEKKDAEDFKANQIAHYRLITAMNSAKCNLAFILYKQGEVRKCEEILQVVASDCEKFSQEISDSSLKATTQEELLREFYTFGDVLTRAYQQLVVAHLPAATATAAPPDPQSVGNAVPYLEKCLKLVEKNYSFINPKTLDIAAQLGEAYLNAPQKPDQKAKNSAFLNNIFTTIINNAKFLFNQSTINVNANKTAKSNKKMRSNFADGIMNKERFIADVLYQVCMLLLRLENSENYYFMMFNDAVNAMEQHLDKDYQHGLINMKIDFCAWLISIQQFNQADILVTELDTSRFFLDCMASPDPKKFQIESIYRFAIINRMFGFALCQKSRIKDSKKYFELYQNLVQKLPDDLQEQEKDHTASAKNILNVIENYMK